MQAAEAARKLDETRQLRQQQGARGKTRDNQQQGRRGFLEAASKSASESEPRAGPNPSSSREKTSHSIWAHDSVALTPRDWGVVGKGRKDHPSIDVAQSRLTKGRKKASMRKRVASQDGIFASRGEREKTIAQEKEMLESSGSVRSRTSTRGTTSRSTQVSRVPNDSFQAR